MFFEKNEIFQNSLVFVRESDLRVPLNPELIKGTMMIDETTL